MEVLHSTKKKTTVPTIFMHFFPCIIVTALIWFEYAHPCVISVYDMQAIVGNCQTSSIECVFVLYLILYEWHMKVETISCIVLS